MANIAVREFTYKSVIDKGTIIVSVFADGKLIKDLEFSATGYTIVSAEASVKSTAENFGILGPGNVDLYEKSTTPTTAPPEGAATPEVKVSAFTTTFAGKANSTLKAGDTYTVSLFGDGVLIKQVPFTAAGKYANPFKAQQDVKFDAEQAGALSSDGKTKYISGTSTPKSATTVYKYDIKRFGPKKYIVVYEISNTGEKEIYQSQQLIGGTPDDVFIQTAIQSLESQYPGVKSMTRKTPPPPTVPKTEPPVTPPPSPLPEELKTTEPPKYLPEAKYKKAKNTPGGEFIVKATGEDYKGLYIETYRKQYFAGSTPEQNGVELEKLERSFILDTQGSSIFALGLSLLALLQSAFKKQLSQDEINKGIAKRYFVQDNRDKKISETSEELFEQGKKDLPEFTYIEVPWNITNPAEDITINGAKFQGSESRNKEVIKSLESQMPGISNYVTDYRYLIPEAPLPPTAEQVQEQTQVIKDPNILDADFRKASFDQRK